MRTGRPKKPLTLSPENRERLESLAHRGPDDAGWVAHRAEPFHVFPVRDHFGLSQLDHKTVIMQFTPERTGCRRRSSELSDSRG